MNKFPAFYRFPFAYLSSFLIIGIIFNFFYASKVLTFLFPILAITTTVLFLIFRKHLQRYFILFTAVSFISIGYTVLANYNSTHFEDEKSTGVLVLRVDEFQKKEDWSK